MSGSDAKTSLDTPEGPQSGAADTGIGRRRAPRRRMLKSALASFCNRYCSIPCTVRDLSETGARLRCEGSVNVPDRFALIVELDGIEADCQVAWRRGTEIGVTFIGAVRKTEPRRQQVVDAVTPRLRPQLKSRQHAKP